MLCQTCGTSLPENYRFCVNCTQIFGTAAPKIISYGPTAFIHNLYFWREGESANLRKGFGSMKEYQGFRVCIVLHDKDGNEVASDGELEIHLGSIWAGKVHVKKEDFSNWEFYGGVAAGVHQLAYGYLHLDPVVSSDASGKLEVWFRTPEEKKLYKSESFSSVM